MTTDNKGKPIQSGDYVLVRFRVHSVSTRGEHRDGDRRVREDYVSIASIENERIRFDVPTDLVEKYDPPSDLPLTPAPATTATILALIVGALAWFCSGTTLAQGGSTGNPRVEWSAQRVPTLNPFAIKYRAFPHLAPDRQNSTPEVPSREVAANWWNWTQPAPHHANAVRISSSGMGTTGVYVTIGDKRGVLSCAHGKSGDCRLTFSDGFTATKPYARDGKGFDLAWIEVAHPSLNPLTVATTGPRAGETVEVLGFGGGRGDLRHYELTATGESYSTHDWYRGHVLNGDSGGPVLNARHEVVGVMNVGSNEVGQVSINGTPWPVLDEPGSSAFSGLAAFVRRIQCPGGTCPYPNGGGSGGGGDAYPPANPPSNPPTAPAIDLDALVDRLAADPRFRGPQGEKGADGAPGANGADGTVSNDQLAAISAAILERIQGDPRFRGPEGPSGPPGSAPDVEALKSEILASLPPIRFETVDDAGNVRSSAAIHLGGTLQLNHRPIPD